MTKIYPFKFLNAYTAYDTKFFFGRNEEIAALYEMIFQTNMLVVYGASGTGKTSLIQCGLAGKFKPHDWQALYIRRGTDLNASFANKIEEHGATNSNDLDRSFKEIYCNSFRPLYLIFDQFEELFILGEKEEQDKFVATVKAILNVEQPVKMIFSIREEYLGHLAGFEQAIPQLMRKKLRIEPMNKDKVQKVIDGVTTLKGSIISIKTGEEQTVADAIFDKIKEKERSLTIQLPYLQVFLDKLYDSITHDKTQQAEAIFTLTAIRNMGDIGNVLRDFLEEQVTVISERLNTTIDSMWKVLSPFATLEGTKEPMSIVALQVRLKGTDTGLINNAVAAFAGSRILRQNEEGNIYELAHDTLAVQIAGKRTDEEIALLEVRRMIKGQLNMKADARELFSEKQLNFIEPYLNKLTLDDAERKLVDDSIKEVQAKRMQKKRRNFAFISGLFVILIVISFLGLKASRSAAKANTALNNLTVQQAVAKANEKVNYGEIYKANGNEEYANECFNEAIKILDTVKEKWQDTLSEKISKKIVKK